MSDSGNSTWNAGPALATFGPSSYLVYDTAAGITTVTFNNPGSNSANVVVIEVGQGLNNSSIVDQSTGAQISGTTWTSGNMPATTNARDLLLNVIYHAGSATAWASTGNWAPLSGTGFTAGVHNNAGAGHSLFAQSQIVSATGAYAGTGTADVSATFNTIVFALKEGPPLGTPSGSGIATVDLRINVRGKRYVTRKQRFDRRDELDAWAKGEKK
jgi:hypothetical protein